MSEPTRICKKCGIEKPLRGGFYLKKCRNPKRSGRYYSTECRECGRAYMNARTAACRAYVTQYKLERGCMDCGLKTDRPEVYDLDHRPGEKKVGKISEIYQSGVIAAVIAEVAKCDVVCANCHRIRTFDRMKQDAVHSSQDWDLRQPDIGPPALFDLPTAG